MLKEKIMKKKLDEADEAFRLASNEAGRTKKPSLWAIRNHAEARGRYEALREVKKEYEQMENALFRSKVRISDLKGKVNRQADLLHKIGGHIRKVEAEFVEAQSKM